MPSFKLRSSRTVELAPAPMEDFYRLRARIMLLDGSSNAFLFASPESVAPQADPTGAILGANTVQVHAVGVDNKTLRLKGLPAGYILTEGDFLGVTYNTSRRGLYVACQTVTADGSGVTPAFEVRSYLRPGTAVNDVVSLVPPVAKVKILPDTLGWSGSGKLVTVHFTVRQTLGA